MSVIQIIYMHTLGCNIYLHTHECHIYLNTLGCHISTCVHSFLYDYVLVVSNRSKKKKLEK